MGRRTRTGKNNRAYLVNHHDSQQIAKRRKECSIQIVLCCFADFFSEDIKDELAHGEDQAAKANVDERPTIVQGVCHKHHLQHYVHHDAQRIHNIQHNEQPHCVCWT